ncbi:KilA-N domain-containing protein [Escherichia coli]|nr:KilA-N domain-containing protein [Escherichia coli]
MKSLTLFNQPIRVGDDGMICLTDMWKASGKSDAESPYHYLRNKQTKEFLVELEKNHESVVFTGRNLWREVCCLRLCGLVKPRVQVCSL